MREILVGLSGAEVGLVGGPPMLVASASSARLPRPDADHVRIRGGPEVGREGRFVGLAGPHRLPGGVVSETGRVGSTTGAMSSWHWAISSVSTDRGRGAGVNATGAPCRGAAEAPSARDASSRLSP